MGNDNQAKKGSKKAEKKADKKNSKTVKPTGDAIVDAGAAAAAEAVAKAVEATTAVAKPTKTSRVPKNATSVVINLDDPASASAWIDAFYEQGKNHPPLKGYDQHWNKMGFIHAGPADRLPNSGAVNMVVFLGDMLAKRIDNEDYADSEKSLNFCIEFLTNRKAELAEAKDRAILAAADAIRANQNAVAV